MRLPILQAPDERLREVAQIITLERAKPHIESLRDTFATTDGCIGLAATQLGIPWRILIVDVSPRRTETYLMVNPVITDESDQLQSVSDGCMSIDNGRTRALTYRPKRLTVVWRGADGEYRKQKFSGLLAAAIHHEIDHLNGVLFTDRLAATSTGEQHG